MFRRYFGTGVKSMGTPTCCSSRPNSESGLTRPGPIGVAARVLASLIFLGGGFLALRAAGHWLVPAVGLSAFGILVFLAAVLREPGCEVNLIWTHLLGNTRIDCCLFGPIDRWERGQSK